jgi:prepilin-type N-terminal cleavage/methylation domain-containing protein
MIVTTRKGFSLTELLVIISIIALLSSIVLVALSRARVRSRDTARMATAKQLTLALHMYENDKGTYQVQSAGFQNTGKGYMTKSGVADYTTSIISALKSSGYFTSDLLNDPVYGNNNYFLGICNPPTEYSLYLKVEQTELQQPSNTILSGCEGASALAEGFNYIQGIGATLQTASTTSNETPPPQANTTSIAIGQSGSSASAGISTTTSQITLSTGNTAYIAGGSVAALGASLTGGPAWGAHTLQGSNGKYLTYLGNGTASTRYDATTNSFATGPTAYTMISGNAHSFLRNDGLFVTLTGAGGGSVLYGFGANQLYGGPGTPDSTGQGSHAIILSSTKILEIPLTTRRATYLYDLTTDTFSSGPLITSASNGKGGHALLRPDGKFLVFLGGNTATTNIYDPVANAFSAGPNFSNGTINTGAHSIQLHNGKFFVIAGGTTGSTAYYDPVANSFSAAPGLACAAEDGSHSIPLADGTFIIVCGNASKLTTLFNPYSNATALGPTLPANVDYGGHSFQRPDGKFVVIYGSGSASAGLFDAGWIMSGTYTTEDINVATMNASSTIQYAASAPGRVVVEIKTASTQAGLTSATYRAVTAGGNIGAGTGHVWAKLRARRRHDSLPTHANHAYTFKHKHCKLAQEIIL